MCVSAGEVAESKYFWNLWQKVSPPWPGRGAIHTRKSYVTLLCQDSSPKRCVSPKKMTQKPNICMFKSCRWWCVPSAKRYAKISSKKTTSSIFLYWNTCNSFWKRASFDERCQAPKVMATSPVLTVGRPTSPTSPYARALTPLVSTPRITTVPMLRPGWAWSAQSCTWHLLTSSVSQKGWCNYAKSRVLKCIWKILEPNACTEEIVQILAQFQESRVLFRSFQYSLFLYRVGDAAYIVRDLTRFVDVAMRSYTFTCWCWANLCEPNSSPMANAARPLFKKCQWGYRNVSSLESLSTTHHK